MALADVQIPLPALARGLYKFLVAAIAAVVVWAVAELGYLAHEFRTGAHDAGMARAVAVSADGKTVYLVTGNTLICSRDGGANWTQVIPQQPQPAQPPTPAAAPVTVPPLTSATEPQNVEPRTTRPK